MLLTVAVTNFQLRHDIWTSQDYALYKLEKRTLEVLPYQLNAGFNPGTETLWVTNARLQLAAKRLHVTFGTTPLVPGLAGSVEYMTRTVSIDPKFKNDTRCMVLAHELAHLFQPKSLEAYGEEEMFAEGVAYLVVRQERDDIDMFATYLVKHKNYLMVLRTYRKEIKFAAQTILGEQ